MSGEFMSYDKSQESGHPAHPKEHSQDTPVVQPTGNPKDDMLYVEPPPNGQAPSFLTVKPGTEQESRYRFYDRIQFARFRSNTDIIPSGVLFIKDRTISSKHCEIGLGPDGLFYVRDVSRNGTRLDDRRLEPNIEQPIQTGQKIRIGLQPDFYVTIASQQSETPADTSSTQSSQALSMATVLVGTIENYTGSGTKEVSATLQQSISRVFSKLQLGIMQRGGTVKDHRSDALVGFWDDAINGQNYIGHACQAALELDVLTKELARNKTIWLMDDMPLVVNWSLTTGPVKIQSHGELRSTSLNVIGESVSLAMQLQRFAGAYTGSIISCPATETLAPQTFEFRALGTRNLEGKPEPQELYCLTGKNT
jgi:class 3 adenylate cyclase